MGSRQSYQPDPQRRGETDIGTNQEKSSDNFLKYIYISNDFIAILAFFGCRKVVAKLSLFYEVVANFC